MSVIVVASNEELQKVVQKVANDENLTTIRLQMGTYTIKKQTYLRISSAMRIEGDPKVAKKDIIVKCGIHFKPGIQGNCHLQHMTLRQAKMSGVWGQSSFTMQDVIVEKCRYSGVEVWGTDVVGRCTNVEVKECGFSGVVASYGASITLVGDTNVHHNCRIYAQNTDTKDVDLDLKDINLEKLEYGLKVSNPLSSIKLVSPLTKENVSIDNSTTLENVIVGANWGASENGDINQIITLPTPETKVEEDSVCVPKDCTTLLGAVDKVHGDDRLTTIVLGKGEHQIDGDYLVIHSAMNIVGDPDVAKEDIVVVGGIHFEKGIQGNCHLQHLTLRQAKWNGVYGESSFTMEDVLVEQCGGNGVSAGGTVVARCTNVEVRQCGYSGVVAHNGASITLIGAKTAVHHNCTEGNNYYGLLVYGSSTIQLVSPLTKEQVSHDNGGGGNWGADEWSGDINQIKTIGAQSPPSPPSPPSPTSPPIPPVYGETKTQASSGETEDWVRVPEDCQTLKDAVDRVHGEDRLTTIFVGKGEHQINENYLKIPSAMNIVGDREVPKDEIVVVGGIQFNEGIQGNCHLQHLTLCQANYSGVHGCSSFTMEDVLVKQCKYHGVQAHGVGVVGQCTNVEVRGCRKCGVYASNGASITLSGAKTTVLHNCTTGYSGDYGLSVGKNARIGITYPLTKKTVSTDNGGGGNFGEKRYGTINNITEEGTLKWLDSCKLDTILNYEANKLQSKFDITHVNNYNNYTFNEQVFSRGWDKKKGEKKDRPCTYKLQYNLKTEKDGKNIVNKVKVSQIIFDKQSVTGICDVPVIDSSQNSDVPVIDSSQNSEPMHIEAWLITNAQSQWVEIKFVYLQKAASMGLCSRIIGYALKVLLLEAAIQHKFPYKGRVWIFSKNPCAAVNCYTHAFQLNGFIPDISELQKFKQIVRARAKPNKDDPCDYKFKEFYSVAQENLHKKSEKLQNQDNRYNQQTIRLRFY